MKRKSTIPNFKVEGDHILALVTGGDWREAFSLLGITTVGFGFIGIFVFLIGYVTTSQLLENARYLLYVISSFALILFLITVWPLGRPQYCRFDRTNQTILFTSRKYTFSLLWSQVQFQVKHYNKSGMFFSVLASPPYFSKGISMDPKRVPSSLMENGVLVLGSFRVKNGEQAERWGNFLNAFMTTDQPATELHRQIVEVEIQGSQLGGRTRGLGEL